MYFLLDFLILVRFLGLGFFLKRTRGKALFGWRLKFASFSSFFFCTLLGADHVSGHNPLFVLLLCDLAALKGTLLEANALLVRVLCNLTGFVISDVGVKSGDKHEAAVKKLLDPALVGDDPADAALVEADGSVPDDPGAVEEAGAHEGLVDVELEVTLHTADGNGGVVADDLGAHHGESLALRGVNLPGHDAATGFVLGE